MLTKQELKAAYEGLLALEREPDPPFAGCPSLALVLQGLDDGSLGEAEGHAAGCAKCQRLAHAHFRQNGPGRWLARHLREGESFPFRKAMERHLGNDRYWRLAQQGIESSRWVVQLLSGFASSFSAPKKRVSVQFAFAPPATDGPFLMQVTPWDENRVDVVLHEDEEGALRCAMGTDRPELDGARFIVRLDRGPEAEGEFPRVMEEDLVLTRSGKFFVGSVSFGVFADLCDGSTSWEVRYRLAPEERYQGRTE